MSIISRGLATFSQSRVTQHTLPPLRCRNAASLMDEGIFSIGTLGKDLLARFGSAHTTTKLRSKRRKFKRPRFDLPSQRSQSKSDPVERLCRDTQYDLPQPAEAPTAATSDIGSAGYTLWHTKLHVRPPGATHLGFARCHGALDSSDSRKFEVGSKLTKRGN